jgi:DNA-binding XRE family transcriptional regulator
MHQSLKTPKRRGGAVSHPPYGIELPHLRAWRRYRLMQQSDLAAVADITLFTISKVEHGKSCAFSTVRALARALEVDPVTLRDEPPPTRQPEA